MMMSPGSRPGLVGRAARDDRRQHRAAVARQPHRLRDVLADRVAVDADADDAARHLAVAQLRQQVADRVDRRREADADVGRPLRVGVDRRVDADDLAAHVEERTARVPGIDRRVGLQHRLFASRHPAERTAERRNHPDRDRVAQIERVADGHDPVARLHLRGVAELGFLQRQRPASRSTGSAPCRSASRGRSPSPRSSPSGRRRTGSRGCRRRLRRRGCW